MTARKEKTMRDKKRAGLIVLAVIAALCAAAVVFGSLSRREDNSNPTGNPSLSGGAQKKFSRQRSDYIAAVHVVGVIEEENKTYSQEWILSAIEDLRWDEKNLAIMLYIDSPGGSVYQTDEVYLALERYKNEGKKIFAYMGPCAASGGYYIACTADKIWANRNTLTGSIGVIAGQTFDMTGLMEKAGVKSETIAAGENKNMMNFNEPLTAEQRAIMQGIADEAYEQFTGIVAQSRGMQKERVASLADGRVYTAAQAKGNGLIDEIGSWDDALDDLSGLLDGECNVVVFKYEPKESLVEILRGAISRSRSSLPRGSSSVLAPSYLCPSR